MLNRIKQFLAAPVFEDEEKTRTASLLNSMLQATSGITLVAYFVMSIASRAFITDPSSLVIFIAMAILPLILRFLLGRGNIQLVGIAFSFAMLALVTFSIYAFDGIRSSVTSGYLLGIIIAGLLLGGRAAIIYTLLSVLALLWVWNAEVTGLITPTAEPELTFDLISYSAIFVTGGLLLRYAASNIAESLERASRNERAQMGANRELQALRVSLEQQVSERTRDLERRTAYLETSAEVSRAVSSILEPGQLMREVIGLIQEQFSLYHVAIFMLDEAGHLAEFRAGTGEAGRLLEEQGLRLEVGGHSMIGWCTANRRPRVAQDVADASHPGEETERVSHPLLSEVRSEAALPLIARGRVIGALSVHSDQAGAFDQDTVTVLQTIADQVAIGLDNARLLAESQAALEAERRAYGEIGREAWANLLREGLAPGYRFLRLGSGQDAEKQVVPIGEASVRELRPTEDASSTTLATPIKVRGQTIGVVDLRKEIGSGEWTEEEVALLETLTDQLGVALEGAQLYEDSQRRAAREQMAGEITARMRETLDVETVLETAVREIREAMGLSRVTVRLAPKQTRGIELPEVQGDEEVREQGAGSREPQDNERTKEKELEGEVREDEERKTYREEA